MALRFIRLRQPVAVVFGGSGDDDDVEQVVEHIKRRMGLGGYVVSYRSIESRPFNYPGGYRHLIVAGTYRAEPFPWDAVEELAIRYDSAVPLEEAIVGDVDSVSLPVAKAVVGVMAEFVRETAGTTSKPE